MQYKPTYITIDLNVNGKYKRVTQAKYWNERLQCWKRVFHTWEIGERDWACLNSDIQLEILRELSDNTALISINNYHEFC